MSILYLLQDDCIYTHICRYTHPERNPRNCCIAKWTRMEVQQPKRRGFGVYSRLLGTATSWNGGQRVVQTVEANNETCHSRISDAPPWRWCRVLVLLMACWYVIFRTWHLATWNNEWQDFCIYTSDILVDTVWYCRWVNVMPKTSP